MITFLTYSSYFSACSKRVLLTFSHGCRIRKMKKGFQDELATICLQ